MGQIRARSLKRPSARLSEQLENLPLANEKLPHGTLSSEDDELRLSVHRANFPLLSTFCTLKRTTDFHERPESVLESELVGCSLVLARLSDLLYA